MSNPDSLVHPGAIVKLDSREFKRAEERLSRISKAKMDFLRTHYYQNLDDLAKSYSGLERDQIEHRTELITSIFDRAIDHGLARNVCYVNQQGEEQKAEGVIMFGRTALLREVVREVELNPDKGTKINFGMIDIAGLRKADFLVDKGDKSADVIVNTTAVVIEKAVKEIWDKQIQKEASFKDNHSYYLGRYGGDEFSFALIGDDLDNVKKEIEINIKSKLAEKKAYYIQDDKSITHESIALKNNKIEWISSAKLDENELKIFLAFQKRNLILDKEQIDRVKEKFIKDG